MASTPASDSEPKVFVNRRVRSLSRASHHDSAIDCSPLSFVPATPTNTPATNSPSPRLSTLSPTLTTPPTTSPLSNLDSGAASPSQNTVQIHPPDFVKAHHFHSPIMLPAAPPNSPEIWPLFEDAIAVDSPHLSLNERMAAISLATSRDSFTSAEMTILGEEIPKAPENEYYETRAVPTKGYGCFAIKPIKRGTRILADDPLLIVPVAEYRQCHIDEAFAKLSPTEQALYFTLHSAHGQDPNIWPKHVHSSVATDERCRIEEQHNARVGNRATLISIFQTNCMEMGGVAAVFPNAARFNHSCNPNACFTWNAAIQKETIHTMRDIKKDEQITLAYCDMTHDKATRRWELKHYGFFCDCPACTGDDDDPDSFAALSAQRRYRLMELDKGFKRTRGPYLEFGVRQEGFVEQLLEYAKLLIEEGDRTIRLANTYLDLALVCEQKNDLPSALLCARKALRIQLDCQGPDYANHPVQGTVSDKSVLGESKNYEAVVKRIKTKLDMEQKGSQGLNEA